MSNIATERTQLAILGGGLTGCALALALGRLGLRVTVFERMPVDTMLAAPFDGRVTAIARASKIMLDKIGAWKGMAKGASPILSIDVMEGDGFGKISYDHRDVDDEPLGWIVENRHIREALIGAIGKHPSISFEAPVSVEAISQNDMTAFVDTSDNRRIEAELLALADGRMSGWRGKVGVDAEITPYGQDGLVATFAHEKPHRGIATECFFQDGPLAMLPMCGNRSSIVWALEHGRASAVQALDDDAFTAEVEARYGNRLGKLTLEGPRWCYPLTLVVAERYFEGRIALVGDCAHGIHPIAGQGWNLALRDVASLEDIIAERAMVGLDIGDPIGLNTYANWRAMDGLTLVSVTDGINRLFANDIAPIKLVRQTGLAVVEQLRPAKRFFMLHAMGLIGDLPPLMRT